MSPVVSVNANVVLAYSTHIRLVTAIWLFEPSPQSPLTAKRTAERQATAQATAEEPCDPGDDQRTPSRPCPPAHPSISARSSAAR